jgi:hypothetical protein
MSKSVSDQKVEDVLSSVRRLVSNELPRKQRPLVPDGQGALVLTEAHRVEQAAKVQSSKGSKGSLEERIAELEAAVNDQTDDFEPDGSEDQSQHRPDRIVYTRPTNTVDETSLRASTVRLSQIALIETGPANEDEAVDGETRESEETPTFRRDVSALSPTKPETPEVAEDTADEAPMAVDVPSEPRKSAEVKAFTDPDDVVANIEARIASGRPITEPLSLKDPVKPAETDVDDFDDALTEAVAASVASSTGDHDGGAFDVASDDPDGNGDHDADVLRTEEFNPSIFANDTLDPHVTAGELLSDAEKVSDSNSADAKPEPVPFADHLPAHETADTDVSPTPEVHSEPTATGEAIAALAALPEEEAMRLLISRMIRDELQGDLGEKITRNVRKLVRREVQRALTSKDLT